MGLVDAGRISRRVMVTVGHGAQRSGKIAVPRRARTLAPVPCVAMDERERTELEAAAFRRLVEHLRERTDIQNRDLMEVAGFCRNCLARWYAEAAAERGRELTKDEAREIVYGMPYEEFKARHQVERAAS